MKTLHCFFIFRSEFHR